MLFLYPNNLISGPKVFYKFLYNFQFKIKKFFWIGKMQGFRGTST